MTLSKVGILGSSAVFFIANVALSLSAMAHHPVRAPLLFAVEMLTLLGVVLLVRKQ